MKTDCINYMDCRYPVQICNENCRLYNKTCNNCFYNDKQKCKLYGYELYEYSMPCKDFKE